MIFNQPQNCLLFFLPDRGTGPDRDTSMHAYSEMLKNVCCLEISGGVDFDKAVDAGMRFLTTGQFL